MRKRSFCSVAAPLRRRGISSREMMGRGLMKTAESVERTSGDKFHMKIEQGKMTSGASSKRAPAPASRLSMRGRVETQAAPAWCLPGGVRLAEYALRGGFVASSLLMRGERQR